MSAIPSLVTSNIALLKNYILEAITATNAVLGQSGSSAGFMPPEVYEALRALNKGAAGETDVVAGQTENAAGDSPPGINVSKPKKPNVNIPEPPPAGSYSTGFVMPDLKTISDDTAAVNPLTTWNEPVYNEFMLAELKTKIQNGFDAVATTVAVQNGLWLRLNQRHSQELSAALLRRSTRWTSRGQSMNVNLEEVMTNFGNAYADAERIDRINTASLKADNKQFSISMSMKGEAIVIKKAEDMATRVLELAKQVLNKNIEAFEANMSRYTDVKIYQYENALYHYSKDLLMKIKKSSADIGQFIYNTKLFYEKQNVQGLDYDADVEAYEADSYFNELKAKINLSYNDLSIAELDENIQLALKALHANMEAQLKRIGIKVDFTDKMGAVYAENLRSWIEQITALLRVSYEENETLTIE